MKVSGILEIRIFSGIIAGLIWAPVWHVIITVGLIISSGISIELQLGPAYSLVFGWWINGDKKG